MIPVAVLGAPRPSKIFSDRMVMQRDQTTTFWGGADEGEMVAVEIAGAKGQAQAKGGVFQVSLKLPGSGGPHRLVFKGKSEVVFQDVWLGDVWVCGGGINMDQSVSSLPDKAQWQAQAPAGDLRYVRLGRQLLDERGGDVPLLGNWTNGWQWANSNGILYSSAVAAAFGNKILRENKIKVGLIQVSYGYVPTECWLPKQALEARPDLKATLKTWEKVLEQWPSAQSNYLVSLSNWQVAADLAKIQSNPIPKKPEEPLGPRHERRPGGLYWGMIAPLQMLGVKGVIWFHGEPHNSDYEQAGQQSLVFPALIETWRRDWNQPDLPFCFAQMPSYRKVPVDPEDAVLSHLRESQAKALSLSNVGMAYTLDLGEENNLLPVKKRQIGERLAGWALSAVYGQKADLSPVLKSTTISAGKAILRFKQVGGGLVARDLKVDTQTTSASNLKGFALCGPDRRFYWADGKITGPDTVELSSARVADVVAVRYGWSSFPLANLASAEGIPVLPLRTDNFPPAYAYQAEGIAVGKPWLCDDPATEPGLYQGLTDGSMLDSGRTIWASGNRTNFPKIVTIDLQGLYAIKEIRLQNSYMGGTRNVWVQVSSDGKKFTAYDSFSFSNGAGGPASMPNTSREGISQVRLVFLDVHTPGFLKQTNYRVSLREVEILGSPVQ